MSDNDGALLNEQLDEIFLQSVLPAEVQEVVANSILEGARGEVRGLPIGARAPDFELANQEGEPVRLSERLARGPVVLCFFRGEWCPYCMTEMRAIRRIAPAVHARGASLLCVHPQRVDVSQRMAGDGAVVDVCSDLTQDVLARFDVRFAVTPALVQLYRDSFGLDLETMNASGQWNLPVPATFVIDRDGVIKARQFSHDFTVRVEPSYILWALDALPATSPEFASPARAW